MKKNIVLTITTLIVIFIGVSLSKRNVESISLASDKSDIKPEIITSVDSILMNPSQFTGYIAVEGKVAMVDKPNLMFGLGCSDGCLILPVKCSGDIPDKDSDVLVFGEIKKDKGGGYIFESKKVEIK